MNCFKIKDGHDMADMHSYFVIRMLLVTSSTYSAVKNRNLFFWDLSDLGLMMLDCSQGVIFRRIKE